MTFIGSVTVGGKVAQRAISQIRKCVLEMGGSYSCIVDGFMKILLHT